MRKILIPIDFSPESVNATKVGVAIAKKSGTPVVLLHVLELANEGSFNVEGETTAATNWEEKIFNQKLIQKSRKELASIEADVEKAGVKVTTLLRMGSAFHGIDTIITEQKVDLVVMGTVGNSENFRLVGSVTEKVIRRSGCPVLSVGKKVTTNFKSIVLATSLSAIDDPTLPKTLIELCEMENAVIHLLHVNTPSLFMADHQVKEKMEALAKRLKLKNYTIATYSDLQEETGINRYADSINADFIAMATHGRTGLGHLLAGSIAENVVVRAQRPVFTYTLKKK